VVVLSFLLDQALFERGAAVGRMRSTLYHLLCVARWRLAWRIRRRAR
jgi:hypothetical protein